MSVEVKKLISIMKRHPELLILISCSITLLFYFWSSADGSITRPAGDPVPVTFSPFINDLYSGNLLEQNLLLLKSEVSLIIYYAPWSKSSLNVIEQIEEIAQDFHNQVSFLAVNCWWDGGECRGKNEIHKFPQIFLSHKLCHKSIVYNGPIQSKFLRQFLLIALNPVKYLVNTTEVNEFLLSSQIGILGHFQIPLSVRTLRKFVCISISSLTNYPTHHDFGVISSSVLAKRLKMSEGLAYKYDQCHSDSIPAGSIEISNSTVDYVLHLLQQNHTQLVEYISTSACKSNQLYKVLSKGPTLIGFVSDYHGFNEFRRAAVKHYKKCYRHKRCWCSVSGECEICIKSDLQHMVNPTQIQLKTITSNYKQLVALQKTFSAPLLYDAGPTHLSVQWTLSDSSYATCSFNVSLQFAALNRDEFQIVATEIGAQSSDFALVDIQEENYFVMPKNFTDSGFEMNFMRDSPRFGSKRQPKPIPLKDGQIDITRLDPNHFEIQVITNPKDTLLYYSTPSCGFCSIYSHVLLTFQLHFPNMQNLQILEIDEIEMEGLPSYFTVHRFPSVIYIPANRTNDSVSFSHLPKLTLPRLVQFLLQYSSPSVRAELVSIACDGQNSQKPRFRVCV